MLIDILNSNNFGSYNRTVAQIFGLNAAVYCSELLNVYKKAQIKNKLVDNNYFKVDRKWMFKMTTLSIEEQLVIDQNLMKLSIISKHEDDPDVINFDFNKLVSIAICDDDNTLEKISRKVKIKSPKGVKDSKRTRMIFILMPLI